MKKLLLCIVAVLCMLPLTYASSYAGGEIGNESTGLNEPGIFKQLKLFPNPAQAQIYYRACGS